MFNPIAEGRAEGALKPLAANSEIKLVCESHTSDNYFICCFTSGVVPMHNLCHEERRREVEYIHFQHWFRNHFLFELLS